ncbi:type II secretion system minor pseudopilin GspK [uncultured Roseobacter sp.]|uniref:type II secretion system minor pseudopilin GspK n=1 Tax=uncultured Roseobacter sp. TaxID=114847 RepID=UPI002611628B|nr:type II secretion system minor pseudopilin GspK [uncultured Roseobacter sp.]
MSRRPSKDGVALINVLLVMAIAATLVQAMLSAEERAISETREASNRTQAFALAKGGVASLRSALRRDLTMGPDSDHPQEPWGQIAQEEVTFDVGSYAVALRDAQGLFDLNSLTNTAIAQQRVFARLLAALQLPEEIGARISDVLRSEGPLAAPQDLRRFGIDDLLLDRLAPFVTTLPAPAAINLNTAPEPVLHAVFGNAIVARSLVMRRTARGFLTREDLASLGILQPVLTGWRSDVYDVRVTAQVGSMTVQYARRLLRDPETGTLTDVPQAWPRTQ